MNKPFMKRALAALAILLVGCSAGARHAPNTPSVATESYSDRSSDAPTTEMAPGEAPMPSPPPPLAMDMPASMGVDADDGGDDPPMPSPAAGARPAAPSAAPTPPATAPKQPATTAPVAKSPVTPTPGVSKGKQEDPEEAKSGAVAMAQMLIFTGQLALEVQPDRMARSIDEVVDIAVAMGGYVAQQDNENVTVRVPSGRFRDAMREMEKIGDVTHRTVQAQDVSEEYNDLAVRLKSLRATRQRLEEFLARAKTIAEVLQIEEQLSRLNGEIDRIEGRMRFLSARAAFSTISVALRPKPQQQIVVDDVPQLPPPPHTIPLPIDWLSSVGLDQLLQLR